MPYLRVWDETSPPGTILANTIDTEFQHLKTDIRERVAGIFGLNLAQFTADPIVPLSLTVPSFLGPVTFAGLVTGSAGFSGNLTGTILTASQGNITSLGTLTALAVTGTVSLGATPALSGFIALPNLGTIKSRNFANSADLILIHGDASDRLSLLNGAASLASSGLLTATTFAGNLTGTILTASQGNITLLGTLTSLVVNGTIQVTGGASTAGSVWKSAVGGLTLQGVAGSTYDVLLTNPAGSTVLGISTGTLNVVMASALNVAGVLTVTGGLVGNVTGNLTGNVTGTVLTAAQGNITSLGTLTSLTVTNTISANGAVTMVAGQIFTIGSFGLFAEASSIGQIITGSAVGDFTLRVNAKKFLFSVDNGGTIAGSIISTGFSGNLTGTILTAAQGNITSLGTLTSLTVNGASNFGTAHIYQGVSTSVTGATNIYSLTGPVGYVYVYGDDGAGKRFFDVVLFISGVGPTTISQTSLQGAPAARTYTAPASILQLAMSAGTYTVKTFPHEVN